MSQLNGDKARFQRERKKRNLHRKHIRELRDLLRLARKAKDPLSTDAGSNGNGSGRSPWVGLADLSAREPE